MLKGKGMPVWREVSVRRLAGPLGLAAVALAISASAAYASVVGWGANEHGQLASKAPSKTTTPIALEGLNEVTQVVASEGFGLGLLADGEVLAWGWEAKGRMGNGVSSRKGAIYTPQLVPGLSEVKAISASHASAMALLDDGEVMVWGQTAQHVFSTEPVKVSGLHDVVAISAGQLHDLVLLEDGSVMSWGDNKRGGLGTGNFKSSEVPVEVKGLPEPAVEVSAGDVHSLVLLRSGTVMSFGASEFGQLGDGQRHRVDIASPVPGLSEVTAISAGAFHSLALLRNGTVMSWGWNKADELGYGPPSGPERCGPYGCSLTPVPVNDLSGVRAISADSAATNVARSNEYSLALLDDGTVMGWGGNEDGQLGDGTTQRTYVPQEVVGLTGATSISAGGFDSLAIVGGP
jgi:alpha-tubulin suppressor-like RCC1 family protein